MKKTTKTKGKKFIKQRFRLLTLWNNLVIQKISRIKFDLLKKIDRKIQNYKNLPYRKKKDLDKNILKFSLFFLMAWLSLTILLPYSNSFWIFISDFIWVIYRNIVEWEASINLDSVDLFGKTAWSWIELLVIPLILGCAGLLIKDILNKRALARQEYEVLSNYFSRMSDLIADPACFEKLTDLSSKRVKNSGSSDIKRITSIINAFTSTTLFQLNLANKELLFRFLSDSGLFRFISLPSLDFSGVNLPKCNLSGVVSEKSSFQDACLIQADMSCISIQGADLTRADLDEAKLAGSNLSNSYLGGAILVGANLTGATLRGVEFESTVLINADLTGADLTGASFYCADLKNANFHQAILKDISWDKDSFPKGQLLGIKTAISVPEGLKQHLKLIEHLR